MIYNKVTLKVVRDMLKSHIYIYIYIVVAATSLFLANSVYAVNPESVLYRVNVEPVLVVEVPTGNNITLDLNPNSKTFDYEDTQVVVKTNNVTGYQLVMSTSDSNTYLTRDTSHDTTPINARLDTLNPTYSGGALLLLDLAMLEVPIPLLVGVRAVIQIYQ